MSTVSVRHLDKIYRGNTHILKDLNLDIGSGEFLVLLGPSGCGKSTLLNCIAGLMDVEGGRIEIAGRDVTNADPSERGIAMVFQSYALYPTKTVYGNMAFCLRMKKKSPAEIERKVNDTADLLQIRELLHRKPGTLSGGQRQRAAIGRALVRDADICLFDEPLSNLDAKLRTEMRIELKKLHKKLRSTFVYVTHDQVEAMTLATRVAVMEGGTFSQISTPEDLYDRPANTFVARFIGSPPMNFVHGEVMLEGGVHVQTPDGVSFAVGAYPFTTPPRRGQEVIVGIRPEHFHLPIPGEVTYPTTLTLVEPLGATVMCYCTLGHTDIVASLSPSDITGARSDAPLPLGIDLSKVSLFDRTSGLRL
ncbi:ABC transporter ATP-binding protein [uncultured Deinococcus sp.]|uniref:ABC transporter ATP-binding protein n=1 Tax=uncultured Deinococcus sp. TaxID=158789 RepID=UPI0025D06DD1|nr:ABC transporter ATP-binding protein [uncultured Deinococcus sp.]